MTSSPVWRVARCPACGCIREDTPENLRRDGWWLRLRDAFCPDHGPVDNE